MLLMYKEQFKMAWKVNHQQIAEKIRKKQFENFGKW